MRCARSWRSPARWPRRPLRRNADGPGMTYAPMILPTVPHYGEASLADLASSLLASLGVGGEPNPLGLPETAQRIRLAADRSGEHTSELQSPDHLVCRLLLEKKKKQLNTMSLPSLQP